MSQKWYIRLAGAVQGPFAMDVLKALMRAGQVDKNTPVRAESSGVWIHLGDLVETTAAAEQSPSSGPPPPPPLVRPGPPAVKGRDATRDFPPLGNPPAASSEVIPRRRLGTSRAAKDAQMWAWIGLIGALATVAALLALVLSGAIALPSGDKAETKNNTAPTPSNAEPQAVNKDALPSDESSAKKTEPTVSNKEVPGKSPAEKPSSPAKKPVADVAIDPLKSIRKWYPTGVSLRRGDAEIIGVPAMWFAWNDYGEPVDGFDLDDIEPKEQGANPTDSTKNDEEMDEEEEPATEDIRPKRKRPTRKPEYLFVEVEFTGKFGGKTIEYQSWNGTVDKKYQARLYDDQGREIPSVPPAATKGVKRLDKMSLQPGSTIRDVLVFEVPKHRFEKLRLVLPLAAVGMEATAPFFGFECALANLGREEQGEVGAKVSEVSEMEEKSSEPSTKSKRPHPDSE